MHFFEFWAIISYVLYVIKTSMKRLFVQLWQWILKHKKRLIYGALVLFIGQFCFLNLWWIGAENVVYAADETKTQNSSIQETLTDIKDWSELFHKLVYIFMYPILFVAWKLIDNSLVYGEAFKFDVVLWQLWVIVRNIANFGLGFIFIFKIFQFLIKWQKWDDIKKLIISTLIAWVWIQASWFIMAALIDVSTIVTYGVWWLPLSVLKTDVENSEDGKGYNESLEYNPYVLWTALYVDVNDVDSYAMYLTNGTTSWDSKFISQCETFAYSYRSFLLDWDEFKDVKEPAEELILCPQMVYYYDGINNRYYPTENNKCHLNGDVYYFKDLYGTLEWPTISDKSLSEEEWKDAQNVYKTSIDISLIALEDDYWVIVPASIKEWSILQIWDAHAWKVWNSDWWVQYWKDEKVGLDVYNWWIWKEWELPRLSEVSTTGGYVWVFSSLYSSLMYAWMDLNFTATSDGWLYVKLLNSFLSLWHMLAISIPLVVMLIVFLIRIGILWMAIVLSPMIVLLKVFELDKKIDKESILSYITFENLIPLVFSPAIICFAVSMSTVLVRIINTLNWNNMGANDDLSNFLWWLIKLNIGWISVGIWKLVCSVMCIAITWFLLWAAVKSSLPKWSKLWKQLENWKKDTEGLLWSIPIVPIPWKNTMMWVSTVFGWNGQEWIVSQMWRKIKWEYDQKNSNAVDELLNHADKEKEAANNAKEYRIKTYISALADLTDVPSDWQKTCSVNTVDEKGRVVTTTFDRLELSEKDRVIGAINKIEDEWKRKAFGNVSPTLIGEKTYVFNASKAQYE